MRLTRRVSAVVAAITLTVGLVSTAPAQAKAVTPRAAVTATTANPYGAFCVNLIVWVMCF